MSRSFDEPEPSLLVDEPPAATRARSHGRRRVSAPQALLLLFAVASAAVGQVLLKHGMQLAAHHAHHGHSSLVVAAGTSPWVLGGLAVFGVSAIAWLATLARVPLNIAYPFNALGYLGILTASVLVLHEKATTGTWLGSILVVVGLTIVVTTRA